MPCQEDLFHLFNNKTEVRFLFTDLQHVVKRIQLRECHLKEFASELKEYCSDKVSTSSYLIFSIFISFSMVFEFVELMGCMKITWVASHRIMNKIF